MNIIKLFYFLFIKNVFYHFRQKIFNSKRKTNRKITKIINNLNRDGYTVINNYYSQNQCNILRKKIDKFIKENKQFIIKDRVNSDNRIHGAEYVSDEFKKYYSSEFLKSIGEEYCKSKLYNLMTMANRISYKKKNNGSGNGWHRDGINFQYKTILYLNDVNIKNGAFQIVERSNKKKEIFKFCLLNNLNPFNTRINDKIIKKNYNNQNIKIKSFLGKQGTLIIVDTSSIHRGAPLKMGKRYAVTNYYYPKNLVERYKNHFDKRIIKKFN